MLTADMEKAIPIGSGAYDINLSEPQIYDVSRKIRGFAVIINNFKFADIRNNLCGGEEDSRRLSDTFKGLQFTVDLQENVSGGDIKSVLQSYGEMDHTKYGCFVCVLSSHGSHETILGADGELVCVPEVLRNILSCPSLEGKPKLFFIDACRGLKDSFSLNFFSKNADYLLCYSALPGTSAYMMTLTDGWKGSRFIKSLCDVFREYGEEQQMEHLLMKLKKAVKDSSKNSQNVEIRESLTKIFFFKPDRWVCKVCHCCNETGTCLKCSVMERSNVPESTDNDSNVNCSDFEEYKDVNRKEPISFGMAQSSVKTETTKKKNPFTWAWQKVTSFLGKHRAETEEPFNQIDDIADDSLCGQREPTEIRVVLVGRTGSGKSATGNLLLSTMQFESLPSGDSVTRQCKAGISRYKERKITVIDTPGIFDTKLPLAKISEELIRCIHMSLPGPHVFLLVVAASRFTNEEIETFNHLFDLFGSEMDNFAIITFTRLDELERNNRTIEDYIESSPTILKEFLHRCRNQYVAINNQAEKKQRKTQIRNLVKQIDFVKQRNEGLYYTNKMYKAAEAKLQQRVEEVKQEEHLRKQLEVKQIESKFVEQITNVKEQNEELLKYMQIKEAKHNQVKLETAKYKANMEQMQMDMKKIDKKKEKELYEAKQKEKKEQEEKIIQLKIKDQEMNKLLDRHKKELIQMDRKRVELEKQKEEDIYKYKTDFEQKLSQQIKQVVDKNNTALEAMQRENEALRNDIALKAELMQRKEEEGKIQDRQREQKHAKDNEKLNRNLASQNEHIREMSEQLKEMNKATQNMNSKCRTVENELADQKTITDQQHKTLSDITREKDEMQKKEKLNSEQIKDLIQQNKQMEAKMNESICLIA